MKKLTPFQWLVTAIGVFLLFFNSVLPPIIGLNPVGMATLCIFAGMILMMVFVSLSWPVMLAVFAYYACGIYTMPQALSMSLGHQIVWLVAFSCMLLAAVEDTGLLRRIAIWMISFKITKKNPWIFVGLLFLSIYLVGCVMDVTAICLLYAGIVANILKVLNVEQGNRFGALLQIGVMVFVGMGMSATPIGHSMAVVSMEYFAHLCPVSWTQFTIIGFLGGIILLLLFMVAIKFFWPLEIGILKDYDPTEMRKELGPMSKEEKVSGLIYLLCVVLWLLPSFMTAGTPVADFLSKMTVAGAPLICTVLCCIVQVNGKPLMDFTKTIGNRVQWGACLTVSAAMMTAAAIQNPDAAIPAALAVAFGDVFSNMPGLVFVLASVGVGWVITQFCPSTIPMVLVESIALALIESGAVTNVHPGAYAIVAAVAIGTAYCTAPASTFAAITAGQGWVTPKEQFVIGGYAAVVSYLVSCLVLYPLACLMLG